MAKVKKYQMTYNGDHYTVAANDIIRGKQTMTLQTARLIRLLITQVVKQDKELKTYSCRIQDLAEFIGVVPNNLYRDIKDVCDGAMRSVVYIGTGDSKAPWKMFHWLSTAEYDGNGTVTLRLSDEIKPYVLELDRYFTQYQLKNILQFKSYYAIRLYELIKCEDGRAGGEVASLYFDFDELREVFGCEEKYERISQFKEKVINIAVREINEKSDVRLIPKYKKVGRNFVGADFEIHENFKVAQDRKEQR